MLTTMAFARLCRTTKKTLIHYERIGLLKPYKREGIFRLYQPKQVLVFQKIILLKSFGVSLHDIPAYLNTDKKLVTLLNEQEKVMEVEVKKLKNHIQKIQEYYDSLRRFGSIINPSIKIMHPYWMYSLEKKGRYIDIKAHQEEIFSLLADSKYQHPGLTVFKDTEFSPNDARMETAIFMGDKKPANISKLNLIQVPEHRVVSYTHIGSYSYLSYIWQILSKYLQNSNLQQHLSLNPREIYWRGSLAEIDEDNFVTELQIPLKK